MKRLAAPAFAALLVLTLPAVIQAADTPEPDDKSRLEEQARRLHEEADAIRLAADARHAEAKKACWQKFLVNACVEDVTRAMQDEKIRANNLDKEARGIERELKQREIAAKDARRAERDATRASP